MSYEGDKTESKISKVTVLDITNPTFNPSLHSVYRRDQICTALISSTISYGNKITNFKQLYRSNQKEHVGRMCSYELTKIIMEYKLRRNQLKNTEKLNVLPCNICNWPTGTNSWKNNPGFSDRVCFAKQDRFEFEEEALEAVQKGRAWGALYFSSNYSNSLKERLENARYSSELTVNDSNVMVQMDMSSE
jgi:hypothetical protein